MNQYYQMLYDEKKINLPKVYRQLKRIAAILSATGANTALFPLFMKQKCQAPEQKDGFLLASFSVPIIFALMKLLNTFLAVPAVLLTLFQFRSFVANTSKKALETKKTKHWLGSRT